MPVKQLGCVSLSSAQKLIDHVIIAATKDGLTLAVSVVDCQGGLVAFAAMDHAANVATGMSQSKAKAALMGLSTTELSEALQCNSPMLAALSQQGLAVVGGGTPIFHKGKLIGAIGVGGATPDQDQARADAAVAAIFDN